MNVEIPSPIFRVTEMAGIGLAALLIVGGLFGSGWWVGHRQAKATALAAVAAQDKAIQADQVKLAAQVADIAPAKAQAATARGHAAQVRQQAEATAPLPAMPSIKAIEGADDAALDAQTQVAVKTQSALKTAQQTIKDQDSEIITLKPLAIDHPNMVGASWFPAGGYGIWYARTLGRRVTLGAEVDRVRVSTGQTSTVASVKAGWCW